MQHTGPDVVIKALQHHNIPRPLMRFVHFLRTKRTITTSHQGHTLTCMVSKGCPRAASYPIPYVVEPCS